ncbi:hypothetical protein [Limnoglobus roseus]|uniref:Uncharacterized protein n=1 Tax=Limnoglobus roseus TaxID=2598579 RepID=A0A5C1AV09_9BACT|nr:hypothetical protein [Limnoglobus roseus]QEL21104.1 hypothetical protein PX52LOC_08234 [Limnoglobus roseus]
MPPLLSFTGPMPDDGLKSFRNYAATGDGRVILRRQNLSTDAVTYYIAGIAGPPSGDDYFTGDPVTVGAFMEMTADELQAFGLIPFPARGGKPPPT